MQQTRNQTDDSSDVAAIKRHVVSLFDAFLAKDRRALLDGRVRDWTGFQIQSRRLIRGVDEYAEELDRVLASLKIERYEFIEFEVEVLGEIALVFYVARDWLAEPIAGKPHEQRSVLIRALDVYRRTADGWTQMASNINSISEAQE